MKKLIITAVAFSAISTTTVHAMNDQLESALVAIGVTGGMNWIVNRTNVPATTQRNYESANRSEFPNFVCNAEPLECAYQQGIYDQAREQWQKSKEDAYNCGRYGRDC
jgi:hypothetical protein|tara:strand:+ start:527 stop:850 length:324 start_codon:yes stop_codon:yes gene_type:complete